MTDDTETTPADPPPNMAAHVHLERPEFEPTPGVQAYVTTISLSLAHSNAVGPSQVIYDVTEMLERLGIRGIIVGVSSVELRGDGGLIGF